MTSVTETGIDDLRAQLAAHDAVLTDSDDVSPFEQGWRYGHGRALAVVRPDSTDEVARVLRFAQSRGLRIQPIGANTGLVGASNPDATGEQLVLSLERLSRQIEVDPRDRTAIVDAGVTLSELNATLEPHGLMFPIDLGADPQIGGMVVTNTGGSRLCRYGDVRANLLGIEAVLADGTVVNELRCLRKNNTGLDLKQLFTGTSGTFGIITRVALELTPRPRQRIAILAALENGDAVLELLATLERNAGEMLSAFEVLSSDALEVTLRHGSNVRAPFESGVPAFTALVELSTTLAPEQLDLADLIQSIVESHAESHDEGLVDVVFGRAEEFWAIRHQVSESLREEGNLLALDLSVPRTELPNFTARARELVAARYPFVRICDYGHWADGGTHMNLVWPRERADEAATAERMRDELQTLIYDLCVHDFAGSYSAEHGIGPHNALHYARYSSPTARLACRALKRALDPMGRIGHIDLAPDC